MITIEGLKKSYAGRPVLQGIDLTVKAGEFLVVLGPSGAGKSTLLRCINGLAQPDAGRTVIDGTVFDAKRSTRGPRPVAMIFQHHNLVKRLSVLKNVLVGRMAGLSSFLSMLQLFPAREDEVRWDVVLLRRVAELWTEVLRGAGPSGLEHAMEIVASIREERPLREPAFFATVDPGPCA